MVKVNWSRIKVNGYWSESILGFWVGSQVEQQNRWRHPMTCRWRGLGLMWRCLHGCWRGVMTSSGDVRWHQQQFSTPGWSVWCSPAHGGEAWNEGGAWWSVWGRMEARISSSIDRWTRRPIRQRVSLKKICQWGFRCGEWEIFRS